MKSFKDLMLDAPASQDKELIKNAITNLEYVISRARRYANVVNTQASSATVMVDGVFVGKLQTAVDILRSEIGSFQMPFVDPLPPPPTGSGT